MVLSFSPWEKRRERERGRSERENCSLVYIYPGLLEEPFLKVEVYVRKLNGEHVGRIRARFLLYDEANSDFSDYQRLTDARYEEESTIEAD